MFGYSTYLAVAILTSVSLSVSSAAADDTKWLKQFPKVEKYVIETDPDSKVWYNPCTPPATGNHAVLGCTEGIAAVPVKPTSPCISGLCGPGVGLEGTQYLNDSGELMQFDQ